MDTRTLCAAGTAQSVGQGRFPVLGQDAAEAPQASVVAFPDHVRPTKVVTLRITPAQHQRIVGAAHLGKTSMNQLLVAAAMQAVEAAEQQDAERIRTAVQAVA